MRRRYIDTGGTVSRNNHSPSAAGFPPRVLLLAGLPGAGKSTLAERLATRLGWSIIDRDDLRAALFPQGSASVEEKAVAFEAVVQGIEQACRQGGSVIVDGMPFSRLSEFERLVSVAQRAGARVAAVRLECPVELAEARITAAQAAGTAHPAPDRRPGLAAEVAARCEPLPAWVLRLDATLTPVELERRVLAHLTGSPPE